MNDTNTFTCKFCKAILTHPEFYVSRHHTETGYDFYCCKCKASYYVDHTTRRIWFYRLWAQKYFADFIRDGSFIVRDNSGEKLIELDQYPNNITPENVETKLNLFLTFS